MCVISDTKVARIIMQRLPPHSKSEVQICNRYYGYLQNMVLNDLILIYKTVKREGLDGFLIFSDDE